MDQTEFCLGPTHEEAVTDLVAQELRSHRQLPLLLYQAPPAPFFTPACSPPALPATDHNSFWRHSPWAATRLTANSAMKFVPGSAFYAAASSG